MINYKSFFYSFKNILIIFFLIVIFFMAYNHKYKKFIIYPNVTLNLIEENFAIPGYSAFQGIDLLNLKDKNPKVFFATGYNKSFVIFNENKLLNGFPLKSEVLDDPELLPAVFALNENKIFWTSWRNGKIYISNSDENNFNYSEWFGGLDHPIGIDGDNEYLYIANHGAHEVIKMDYNKNIIWKKKFELSKVPLNSPYSIKIYKDNILITFQKPFTILKTDFDGNIIDFTFGNFQDGLELDGSSFNNLQSIDFDNNYFIYAIDTFNKRIVVLDENLNMLLSLNYPPAANWRGLKINKLNNNLYITGFKEGLEPTESQTGFWIFEGINIHEYLYN